MLTKTNYQILTETEINTAFNMELESAVFILERAENLSPEGRKYLIEELKRNIAESIKPYLQPMLN